MIYNLNIKYDVDRLWQACQDIIKLYGWGDLNQINLIHRAEITDQREKLFDGVGSLSHLGLAEQQFTVLNDICRGTYIEEIVNALPYRLGRLRIMWLRPRACMSVHSDTTMRIHWPMITNPQALMIFPEEREIVHMRPGEVYLTNTLSPHTAMNGGLEDRYHLVGVMLE